MNKKQAYSHLLNGGKLRAYIGPCGIYSSVVLVTADNKREKLSLATFRALLSRDHLKPAEKTVEWAEFTAATPMPLTEEDRDRRRFSA